MERVGDDELVRLVAGGTQIEVLSYGAHLVSVRCLDRDGHVDDVVVSLRRADGTLDTGAYRDPQVNPHLGGMVGRYANRIGSAGFELDGQRYTLVPNEGANQLHGGPDGFDRRSWHVRTERSDDAAAVELSLVSPDGDQGYPGEVSVRTTYLLDSAGVLSIETVATTDAPTVLSVTNHTYWNLAGTTGAPASATVRDHVLRVDAERIVAIDASKVPTGEMVTVDGTAFDLRTSSRVGEVLDRPAIRALGGVDHCYVLDQSMDDRVAGFAELADPASGRRLRLGTDQPGVQVYTANHGAGPLPAHAAVCLETQHLPDAPNRPAFPSAVLRPGETYRHRHVIRFSTDG
ncbi:MAG: aldose epimerase family protein [Microthrixaceae bacterium]